MATPNNTTSLPASVNTATTQFIGPDVTVGGADGVVGFYGTAGVIQADAIATIDGANTAQVNTAVNSILTVLRNVGLIAS